MFSYLSPEQRVLADHPLRAIRQITDKVLQQLSRVFSRMDSRVGRPSLPPEKLLRALRLQVLYTIRRERMLTEQLNYNLRFRGFVGLKMDDEDWDVTGFTKNRERRLKAKVARAVLSEGTPALRSRRHYGIRLRVFRSPWHFYLRKAADL